MPCDYSHLEPTQREIRAKKCAMIYRWLLTKLGEDVPESLNEAAEHTYGRGFPRAEEMLCEYINEIGEEKFTAKIVENVGEDIALEAGIWWNMHKKEDFEKEKNKLEEMGWEILKEQEGELTIKKITPPR